MGFAATTPRFTELGNLHFPWGLPGFASLRRFAIVSIPTAAPGLWLRSLDTPNVALPVADPALAFPHYRPALPAYVKLTLDVAALDEVALYCVVLPNVHGQTTINLAAPIVINKATRTARQALLEDSAYEVRTPFGL